MHKRICIIGLNHRTAPVEVREKYALDGKSVRDLGLCYNQSLVQEVVMLSTCNRVELLLVGDSLEDIHDEALSRWAKTCGQNSEELARYIYTYTDLEAVSHIFNVASSLDSMVPGEPQILGQLKEAYRRAVDQGTTSTIINRLMHKSFSVAKRIRNETGITKSAVSISYAAVELAKGIFAELGKQRAMLIGAGEMAELAAEHLLNAGVENILVTNRTYSRAQEMAQRFQGRAVPFSELFNHLAEVDIVLSSTGATQTVIQAEDMRSVLKKRKYRPMFIIDIAVPRDIDPDVNALDNIYLYDIDDLKGVVEENLANRKEEAKLAQRIIQEEVGNFQEWLRSLELKPTIVDLLEQAEQIAQKELQKSLKNLDPKTAKDVADSMEKLAMSLCKKLYHHPITFLKRKAQIEEDSAQYFISLVRRMYSLDDQQSSFPNPDSENKKNKE